MVESTKGVLAMGKESISKQKKQATPEQKRKRLKANYSEFTGLEHSFEHAFLMFIADQEAKGNSKSTITYYKSFYKKLLPITENGQMPVNMMTQMGFVNIFLATLGDINQQSKNTYLRAYRAFGNYLERKGILDGFECPIKEIEPPLKNVYTMSELKALTTRPNVERFEDFRNYMIIVLVLSTGARANTLINIKLDDVDLDEGYITFNTTKANKVVRIGLDKKALRELKEYINLWRSGTDVRADDYLFCNVYGEQLTRSGLSKAIRHYNESRGVSKTSIHLLRHTFAKNWITSGGDIITLAKVLTHSELEMVKRYSNLYGTDIKKEIYEHSTMSQLRTNSGPTLTSRKKGAKE